MVKEENAHYHNVNKFVVAFLNASAFATPELIDEWKTKSNLNKLKSAIKKTDKPSHPPRPKSEYIFFCEEVRPIIQEEMRRELGEDGKECKIDIHDVTCELGRRWKQFKQVPDPEMKKRIAELAETDRKRYHIEKDAMQKKETKNDNHLKSKYLYYFRIGDLLELLPPAAKLARDIMDVDLALFPVLTQFPAHLLLNDRAHLLAEEDVLTLGARGVAGLVGLLDSTLEFVEV